MNNQTFQGRILKRDEYSKWDDFVAKHSLGNIHQVSSWGEFQKVSKGQNWGYWIVVVEEKGEIVGGGLVLRRLMPLGKCWLYVAKGPLMEYLGDSPAGGLSEWLRVLKELGLKEKAVYLRVEPGLVMHGPEGLAVKADFDWKMYGFRPAHAHYQPENTVIMDIGGTEEQILAKMKPKGRYNIKLAEKKGVKVLIAGQDLSLEDGVHEFHKTLNETTSRDGFSGHPEKYYLEMLKSLGEYTRLYLAEFEGKIIAGILVTFYGEMAIYYFGASANQYRNVMAPYLLQWNAIIEAKKQGIRWYDFLGTAPLTEKDGELEYDTKHAWAGVTEFKLKFGGLKVDFYPGMEKIYNPLFYWLMRFKKIISR